MGFTPCDLRLVDAVDEHERSWLVFDVAVGGDASAGRVHVLEASVRLAGLEDDPAALRRSISDRLNGLLAQHGRTELTTMLRAGEEPMRMLLWPPQDP